MFSHLSMSWFLLFSFLFLSFILKRISSYLAWSWFFWFWASADSKFLSSFLPFFFYSTLVYFFKIPFSCSPSLFLLLFPPIWQEMYIYHTIPCPSFLPSFSPAQAQVNQRYARYPLPFQHEFYFDCVFVYLPNFRRFEVSYSNFVCVRVLSIIFCTEYSLLGW